MSDRQLNISKIFFLFIFNSLKFAFQFDFSLLKQTRQKPFIKDKISISTEDSLLFVYCN